MGKFVTMPPKKPAQQEHGMERSYRIPFHENHSLMFQCFGAHIVRAVLEISNIEIVTLIIDREVTEDEPFNLDFFGGEPLHMRLAENWQCAVTLYTDFDDKRIPSLRMAICEPSLDWETVGAQEYVVKTRISSQSGRVQKYVPADFIYVNGAQHPKIVPRARDVTA